MTHNSSASGSGDAHAFAMCLAQQLDLCRRLEDLADQLPSRVDTRAATILAKRLPATLRRCQRLEEDVIFPALLMKTRTDLHSIIERLRREHQEDEDHACDVRDTILAFVAARDRDGAEELGYMLRCLFMSLRRHLAFDCDHVLPLFRRAMPH